MQTSFTLRQLEDPTISQADEILRRCIHCGFCTATCPTYVTLGDERDSPRGRIYLIKDMLEQGEVPATTITHIDRCLSCLSCMTTCPSGVDYMHLVDMARARIESSGKRPWRQRFKRGFLASVLPDAARFRFLLLLGWMARPLQPLFRALHMKTSAAALGLVPQQLPHFLPSQRDRSQKAEHRRTKRVALLQGCVQDALRPDINDAAIRLLQRHGVEVVLLPEDRCCGALKHHLGKEAAAQVQARHNIDLLLAEMREAQLDAVLVTASGCGTMVKDYGALLARDRGYAARADAVSGLARDICEFIDEIGLQAPLLWNHLRVAYHSPCSLQHGQGIDRMPRRLPTQAGFKVVDLAENHLCCGSAGSYSLLQPALSAALRDRKLGHINHAGADIVATGNIGCLTQLSPGSEAPIVHTVELLDWATGGPCPKNLKVLETKAEPVRRLIEAAGV